MTTVFGTKNLIYSPVMTGKAISFKIVGKMNSNEGKFVKV